MHSEQMKIRLRTDTISVTIQVFDSIDEAIESLGAVEVLRLVNREYQMRQNMQIRRELGREQFTIPE